MRRLILYVSCLTLFAGCGIKRDYLKIHSQLDYLEASNKKMETRLASMDSLLKIQTELTYKLNAEMRTRWGTLNERMMSLDQQREDQQSNSFNQGLPMGSSQPDLPKQPSPPAPPIKPSEKPNAVANKPDQKQLYDTAYLDITRGNYELAISGFREFLKIYPNSALADNSQYWIGEGFYAQKKFKEALTEFEKVIEQYPNQDKAAGAYYKSGLCQKELGNPLAAKDSWQILLKKYPRSPEAKLALDKIKEL
jgi:tol-pal system protein YbgF